MFSYIYFFNLILFQWISVIFFKLLLHILWLFLPDILKVIWKSLHQYFEISIGIAIYTSNSEVIFFSDIFLGKNRTFVYVQCNSVYFLVLSFWTPISLCIWKYSTIGIRKNMGSENFWKLSTETFMLESFLNTLAGLPWSFPKICLEQLFWGEYVSTC